MYIFFHDFFDLSNDKGGRVCREKLYHRVKTELRMCVFVCVGGRVCANYNILYSTSTDETMKWVWNPFLQINITEQCESLCKRQIIFENPPEPTLSLDIGTEKYNILVTCSSVHHVMSSFYFAIHPWRMTISMEVSHHGFFEIFQN